MLTKLYHKEIEQKIIINLAKAKSEVKIAVAWFTNPALYDVVSKLAESDVTVDLVLCDDKMNFRNPKLNFQKLIDRGVQIQVSKPPHLMHNKFCLIDNRILITGSYNWTLRAEQFNFENIIVSTDKELILAFAAYFKILAEKTTRIISIPDTNFQSYYNQKEIDFELQLENFEKVEFEKFQHKKDAEYNEQIWQAIQEADMLYRNAEHMKCIEFCKKEIKRNPARSEFHVFLASSYWRIGNFEEQIKSANKAIEIDNECYDAYNLLGIAYAATGKEQLAIKNYGICLKEYPDDHGCLRNRAIARISLEKDLSIPEKIRMQQTTRANQDFEKIIETINNSLKKPTYQELHSRAVAYGCLDKTSLALKDIAEALEKYSRISNESQLDANELKDMKALQVRLKNSQKSKKS